MNTWRGSCLFCLVQVGDDVVGIPGKSAIDAADLFVAVVGEYTVDLLAPQERQGELQHRQIAGLMSHVVEQPLNKTWLERRSLPRRGLLDGGAQLGAAHRPHEKRRVLQRVGERPVGESESHEIGSKCHEEYDVVIGVRGIAGNRVEQHIEKTPLHLGIGAERVQLLGLINNQQQMGRGRILLQCPPGGVAEG